MKEKNQEKEPDPQEKMLPFFSYNQTVYTPDLKLFAKRMLEYLPLYQEGEHLHLITSSSSGAFIASAMIVLSERKIDVLYVRKEKEYSHSSGHGSRVFPANSEFIFVDDTIATGRTLERCIDYLQGKSTGLKNPRITRVIIATDVMMSYKAEKILKENNIQNYYSALRNF